MEIVWRICCVRKVEASVFCLSGVEHIHDAESGSHMNAMIATNRHVRPGYNEYIYIRKRLDVVCNTH